MTATTWRRSRQGGEEPSVECYRIQRNGKDLDWEEALLRLRQDQEFRDALTDVLRRASFAAYFFETPPHSKHTLAKPFEFALIEGNALETQRADPSSFAEHFPSDGDQGAPVVFENLGRDARLVVPRPQPSPACCAHLAAFVRSAEESVVDRLWVAVGEQAELLLGLRPRWLSTAGLGVPWLHVRLDARPKYYRHAPYRSFVG